jgi:hypothetical protein
VDLTAGVETCTYLLGARGSIVPAGSSMEMCCETCHGGDAMRPARFPSAFGAGGQDDPSGAALGQLTLAVAPHALWLGIGRPVARCTWLVARSKGGEE